MRNFLDHTILVVGMIGALFILLASIQLVELILKALLIWN
jgi:hypothetical protein